MYVAVRPVLTAAQLPPLSTLLNTPPRFVPVYSGAGGCGPTARANTDGSVRPVLTAAQLPPALTLLNTPKIVPAYPVAGVKGSIARVTDVDVRPVLARTQFPPPLTLLK